VVSLAIIGVIAVAGAANAIAQRYAVHRGVDAWPLA
jgi:hypothetical protein